MDNYAAYVSEVSERVSSTTIATPEQRVAFKKGYSFSGLSYQEQLKIWDHIWRASHGFLAKVQAFLFLEQQVRRREIPPTLWDTVQHWQEQVDGWGLCDCLAKIYTKILEIAPAKVYARLREWNTSDNLWKRRQSVVSLLYFSGTKKTYLPFNKIKALVVPLLGDPEYYVQKGVGWTLREMYSVYPGETLPLLEKHIHQISSIAFTIAIEKMDKAQKDRLKIMRKKKA
jgi:3-methyladenine DNA glycosylase AlkD